MTIKRSCTGQQKKVRAWVFWKSPAQTTYFLKHPPAATSSVLLPHKCVLYKSEVLASLLLSLTACPSQ